MEARAENRPAVGHSAERSEDACPQAVFYAAAIRTTVFCPNRFLYFTVKFLSFSSFLRQQNCVYNTASVFLKCIFRFNLIGGTDKQFGRKCPVGGCSATRPGQLLLAG